MCPKNHYVEQFRYGKIEAKDSIPDLRLCCKYVTVSSTGDSLKSKIGEKRDAQEDGGNTTTEIRDHCQDLTVSRTDVGSGNILRNNIKTEQYILYT